MNLWTEDEVDLLESFMRDPDSESVDDIAKIIGRTPKAVISKMQRIRDEEDVDWKLKPKWTEQEINYLSRAMHYMTYKEIGLRIKKTPDAVKLKVSKLGLSKKASPDKKSKEIRELANEGYTRTEIAKKLGFSYMTICGYIWYNKIECVHTEKEISQKYWRDQEKIRYQYDRGKLKR